MRAKALCKFILAREAVRVAKEAGKPRPWTKDPILNAYRFCNVHREDDRVTRWIATHWREPFATEPDLWFALVFARLFNLPRTLEAFTIFDVLKFRKELIRKRLKEMREHGPIFNGAYIVSTNGRAMDKVDYLLDWVLTPMWASHKGWRPMLNQTLADYHIELREFDGLGSFMAAQVVADLKYVEPLRSAVDWHTWAAPGPGSKRGLNRVCERPVGAPWPGQSWLVALHQLHDAVHVILPFELHAQDLQNCLCEFDKMERVRLGEGTPKQLYRPYAKES